VPAREHTPGRAAFRFVAVAVFVLQGLPDGGFGQDTQRPEPTADNPLTGEAELSF